MAFLGSDHSTPHHTTTNVYCAAATPSAPIELIAKLEAYDCLAHLDEIIMASDGIMVARGDLGAQVRYSSSLKQPAPQAVSHISVCTEWSRLGRGEGFGGVHPNDLKAAQMCDVYDTKT